MSTISSFSNNDVQSVQGQRPAQGQRSPSEQAPSGFEIQDTYTPSNAQSTEENSTYGNYARSQSTSQANTFSASTSTMSASEIEDETAQNLEDVTQDTSDATDDESSNTLTNQSFSNQSFSNLGSLTNSGNSSGKGIDVSELVTRYDELFTNPSSSSNAQFAPQLLTTQTDLDNFKNGIISNIETQNKSLEIFKNMYAGNEISAEDNDFLYKNNKTMYGFAASHLLQQEEANKAPSTDTESQGDDTVDTDTNADTETTPEVENSTDSQNV